jgi:hypothetical protein
MKKTKAAAAGSRKRSWREKLADNKGLPKIAEIDCTKTKRWGTGTFVIPAPLEVDAAMRQIRHGKLTTIEIIRAALAQKHGTTIACPLTTGIFAWIAAHAAAESEAAGARRITPYWRTLKSGGELNPRYPGGIADLHKRLASEGHKIVQRGKRFFVADFQACMVEPNAPTTKS